MKKIASTLAVSLVAVGVLHVPAAADDGDTTTDIVHEAMAVVGQEVDPLELQVAESRPMTAHARTDEGTIAITTESAVDSAMVRDEQGFQVMAVLRDGATRTSYDLTLPEGVELVPADGGYDLVAAGDVANLVLGTIEEPWAVDADGRDVATSYEVDGGQLVQHIHGEVTYPVVVDPKVTLGVGVYLNAWGAEWNALRGMIVAAGGAVVVGACVIVNIPNPWAAVLKLACGTVGASNLKNFTRWVRDAVSGAGMRATTCYQTRIFPNRPGFAAVNAKNCR